VVALAVLAVAVFAFLQLGGGTAGRRGSATSSARNGRLAAFLLLESLGLEPQAWSGRPGELPEGPHQVWLADAPQAFRGDDADAQHDADDPLDVARERSLSGLRHYRRFMEQGGTLVLPATERVHAFLRAGLGLDPAPFVDMERGSPWTLPGGVLGDAVAEVRDGLEVRTLQVGAMPAVLEVPVGAGGYRLIPAGDYLQNEDLGAGDNGLFLVRVVELGERGARVLFDEHALGLGAGSSSTGLALSARGRWLTLHLALLLLIVCWRSAWVREFPRDPRALGRVSPLARARGLASLFERAGRYDALAGMLRRGYARRPAPESPGAAAPGTVHDAADLVALDRALRGGHHAPPREPTTRRGETP